MSVSYLQRKAYFPNLTPQPVKICYHEENLYTYFSLGKRLILAPSLGSMATSDTVTATVPLPLCAGSGSPAHALSHSNKLRQQNIHFFQVGPFFLSLCAEMATQTLKRAGMHGQEGQDYNTLQSGNLQPVYWIPISEMTFWAPPLSSSDVSSGWMKYPGL